MPKKECRLLVLSPRARNWNHVQEYKPFNAKSLIAIMEEVAAGVAQRRRRDYDEHAIFRGFFFGRTEIDPELKSELGERVPSSLVECDLYRSSELAAAETAKKALFHFAYGSPAGGKLIIIACSHGCEVDVEFDTWLARSDDALFAYLWSDLSGSVFKSIGGVMGKRSDD